MLLEETIDMMISNDYKERFIAEYHQLKERYNNLNKMINNWDNLDFKPSCSLSIYQSQVSAMKQYLNILELRARVENINLNN
jgi:hypothetical protein